MCVLGAVVLAGSAGFTAGAAGTEGLETGWEKEQETIRETGREEDLEMNPEKMAEIRDQTEANMLIFPNWTIASAACFPGKSCALGM